MRVFVNGEIARLATPVTPTDEVAILMAMSGGEDGGEDGGDDDGQNGDDDGDGNTPATMFPDD
jgi:hypothetical protein